MCGKHERGHRRDFKIDRATQRQKDWPKMLMTGANNLGTGAVGISMDSPNREPADGEMGASPALGSAAAVPSDAIHTLRSSSNLLDMLEALQLTPETVPQHT